MPEFKEVYTHTHEVTFPNGLTATLREFTVTLPNKYKRCRSIDVYSHQTAFTVKLGIQQGNRVIHQLSHPDAWRSSYLVGRSERAKATDLVCDLEVKVSYQPLVALGADETISLLFHCE